MSNTPTLNCCTLLVAVMQHQQEELRDWFLALPREQQRHCLVEMSLSIADVVAKLSPKKNRLWVSEAMRICITHGAAPMYTLSIIYILRRP